MEQNFKEMKATMKDEVQTQSDKILHKIPSSQKYNQQLIVNLKSIKVQNKKINAFNQKVLKSKIRQVCIINENNTRGKDLYVKEEGYKISRLGDWVEFWK